MDLDVLKEKWLEQDRKLDVAIQLNRQLLIATKLNRVQWPLRRFAFLAGLGVALGLIAAGFLGQFIYHNWNMPRFLLPAVVLDIWVIANLAVVTGQIVLAMEIDYDKPLAIIQKQLISLRLLRIRTIQWALLTGQIVWWIPNLIVVLKGFFNVDAYKVFDTGFLLVNVAVGLAIIPLALWSSRRFVERMDHSRAMRWLIRGLAGYNLSAAIDAMTTLSAFHDATNEKREP